VVTPEHNGAVPAYLKNLLDWMSRVPLWNATELMPDAFFGKPALLACATNGARGGPLALQSARNLLSYLGCLVVPEHLLLNEAEAAWDDDNQMTDPWFADCVAGALARFTALLARTNPRGESA
jgi:NAD(P)H-dependent FMN reductase